MPGGRGKHRVKRKKSRKQQKDEMEKALGMSTKSRNKTEKELLAPLLPPRHVEKRRLAIPRPAPRGKAEASAAPSSAMLLRSIVKQQRALREKQSTAGSQWESRAPPQLDPAEDADDVKDEAAKKLAKKVKHFRKHKRVAGKREVAP